MTPDERLDILSAAWSTTNESLHRLTFTLEAKGALTSDELAAIWGETPEPTPAAHGSVRADLRGERAVVHTSVQSGSVAAVIASRISGIVRMLGGVSS